MDELYVMARRVLLDALDALGPHHDALVLVGAQAVYLRVGEADLAVAAFTTDGDLAIDPAALASIPPIERTLRDAGFRPASADLNMVPISPPGTGEAGIAARLGEVPTEGSMVTVFDTER